MEDTFDTFKKFEIGEKVVFIGWDPDELVTEGDEWLVPGESTFEILGRAESLGIDAYRVCELTTGHPTTLWSTEMAKLPSRGGDA